ncbi:3352_t:CDS:2, partial [Gigaspora rosea]
MTVESEDANILEKTLEIMNNNQNISEEIYNVIDDLFKSKKPDKVNEGGKRKNMDHMDTRIMKKASEKSDNTIKKHEDTRATKKSPVILIITSHRPTLYNTICNNADLFK